MPAKSLSRVDEGGAYCHIYNKGVEKRAIFNDVEDYRVFLSFLKDYLAPPKDPDSVKKVFEIHGRTFRGMPHQPKNYFNQVELIAYSLMPDHFHLLLHQKRKRSLEKFLRSLCTRYSMYFNKRYQHTGSLFDGPYKSVVVKDGLLLPRLTRFFHSSATYSSYPEYVGERVSSWVKPEIALSFFDKKEGGYKDFVERYGRNQKENQLIDGIMLDSDTDHLERRDLAENEVFQPDPNLKPRLWILENVVRFGVSLVVFLLLVNLGVGNINSSASKRSAPLPTPQVLSEIEEITPEVAPETEPEVAPESTPESRPEGEPGVKSKRTLIVKTGDSNSSVNIRQQPSTESARLGEAHDGDTFEIVSQSPGWYQVTLDDGSGFISADYIETEEGKTEEEKANE